MENKNIAKGLMIGGILIWCVPIIVSMAKWISTTVRVFSFTLMGIGLVVLISGDALFNVLTKVGKSGGSKINYDRMFKKGEITLEDYKKFKAEDLALEKEKLQLEIESLKAKQSIEKEKAELRRLKTLHKPKSSGNLLGGSGKDKMPDVLGNLGGFVRGGDNQGPDPLNKLGGMMSSAKPNDNALREVIGTKKKKTNSNLLEDLNDLF